MRELTEIEIQNESFLKKHEIRFAKVLLTKNILSHHIFDASQSIERFLKEEQVHDFDSQINGEKKYITTHMLTFKEDRIIHTSVYKATKRGDKRMWFGAEILPITNAGDIYLMMANKGELYILNMSRIDIMLCYMTSMSNPIKHFLKEITMKVD